jgi:hypothetical protein
MQESNLPVPVSHESNLPVPVSTPDKKSPCRPPANGPGGHRIFTGKEKWQCWGQSAKMIGRDPERWRMDAYGIPVMNALRGCMGLFCHEYDHIIPYSKGGKTELNNCQILQTKLNREKSNRTDITFSELRNFVPAYSYSELEMDIIERAVYGDVRKPTLHDFVAGNQEAEKK